MAAPMESEIGLPEKKSDIDAEACLVRLKVLTDKFRIDEERNGLNISTVDEVISVLEDVRLKDNYEVIIEAFRSMRNASVNNERNQLLIGQESQLPNITVRICRSLLDADKSKMTDKIYLSISCGIQLLGNLVTGCLPNQRSVTELLWPNFRPLMETSHNKIQNYTCMVLYNSITDAVMDRLISTAEGRMICKAILKFISESENSEWGMYVFDRLLKLEDTIPAIFDCLDAIERLLLLDMVLEKITSSQLKCEPLVYLSGQFNASAHQILGTSRQESVEDLAPRVGTRILAVLAEATALPEYTSLLSDCPQTLECAINLLHGVHLIGKTDKNPFTTASKEEAGDDVTHPAYGLRKDLVRLVGNMSYRHRANQDRVREMGGLQLLLEQSVIDQKNPYITQWSVLAIRNLCEDNPENQAFIADMKLQGVSNRVETLREYGVDAYEEDGKVKIRRPMGGER